MNFPDCKRVAEKLLIIALAAPSLALSSYAQTSPRGAEPSSGNGGIALPPPPQPTAPPGPSSKFGDSLDGETGPSPHENRTQTVRPTQKDLLEATLTSRPRKFLLELALTFPTIRNSGSRAGYTTGPTVHVNGLWRHGKTPSNDVGLWSGVRVAPFSGEGFHKNRPGAYGITYFGPAVGVGKLTPPPRDIGHRGAQTTHHQATIPGTWGYLFTTGIAAATRIGKAEPSVEEKTQDAFGSEPVFYDSPGVWVEARYLRVAYGALGYDFLIGLQTGTEKRFVYGGIAVAGWH